MFPHIAWFLPPTTAAYTLIVALVGEKLRSSFDPDLPVWGVRESSGFYPPALPALTIN
jgi:hypothetical protein